MAKARNVFFAYPSAPHDLVQTISSAQRLCQDHGSAVSLKIWPNMNVFGANVSDAVRDEIRKADCILIDITVPNENVYYEAGYAIGCGKPIAPVVNNSFADAIKNIQSDGIFDNIGYKQYENSGQLRDIILDLHDGQLLNLYSRDVNFKQPLYILDSYKKTDFRNTIISAVKDSKVFYRSFDPVEVPRFSTVSVIADATSAVGVVIPFLAENIYDAVRHNLRGSFLAGISHALGKDVLMLKMQPHNYAAPADYRDDVIPVKDEKQIADLIAGFAGRTLLHLQNVNSKRPVKQKSQLQNLFLGASSAENEFRTLEDYFVETSEFLRAQRGEVSIVAGRKGSGKTAIFFMTRDHFREKKHHLVVDLKPESHQLSLFRESLIKVVDVGVFDHTLAAFWHYVVLSEILITIKSDLGYHAKFDSDRFSAHEEISMHMERLEIVESGDFTNRINKLGSFLLKEISDLNKKSQKITPERITNIIFKEGISVLKNLIIKNTSSNNTIVFLFDNIDKGWPSNGVHEFDVRLVRLLVESLDKVRREFNTLGREFFSTVFLRNDIFELLVDDTPDKGKAGRVRIDWTDRVKLRQVIYKRLQSTSGDSKLKFEELWHKYFIEKVNDTHSFDYFVDHCLMRPRFLINIIEYAVGNAINRGNTIVQEADCIDAVRQNSLYLMDDFGYEIRDISGMSSDILYALVGMNGQLNQGDIISKISEVVQEDESKRAFDLMLWYGIIGVLDANANETFIYTYDYNIKRLTAEIRLLGNEASYVINPALKVALN